jgi:hypothetical protein
MVKQTLGGLTDAMHALREKKRVLEEEIKVLEEQYKELEMKLIELADEQGVTKGNGKAANFTVAESIVPQVENWDDFYRFIHKNKYWHLLERRPSVTGCRELFETKGVIPGVQKFTKRRVNLRST